MYLPKWTRLSLIIALLLSLANLTPAQAETPRQTLDPAALTVLLLARRRTPTLFQADARGLYQS